MINVSARKPRSRSWGSITLVAAAILVYFAARAVLEKTTFGSTTSLLVALAPLPLLLGVLWNMVRSAADLDEMQRRIQLEALAIAYMLGITLLMTLGLLELAIPLAKADWSYRHVWQLMCVFYFGGLAVASRRYL
jgi:Na+/melibiose symporter-like transporter